MSLQLQFFYILSVWPNKNRMETSQFISILNELGAFNIRSSVYFSLFSNLCRLDLLKRWPPFCLWRTVFPPLTSWLWGRESWCPPLDSTAAPEVATRRPPLFPEGVKFILQNVRSTHVLTKLGMFNVKRNKLKVHKRENFLGSDIEICTFS